jgi:hypothetical protein
MNIMTLKTRFSITTPCTVSLSIQIKILTFSTMTLNAECIYTEGSIFMLSVIKLNVNNQVSGRPLADD